MRKIKKRGFKNKAMTAFPFVLVFSLIAGAVILLFFFNIIQNQRHYSDLKLSNAIIKDIGGIITGAGSGAGEVTVSLPKEVFFSCDPATCLDMGCDSRLQIGSAEYSTSTEPVFSPHRLFGYQLIMKTLQWKQPYLISNFVLMTTDQVRYVFVVDTSSNNLLWQQLKDLFPEKLNYQVIPPSPPGCSSVDDTFAYQTRFVFIDQPINTSCGQTFKNEVSYLNLSSSTFNVSNGTTTLPFFSPKFALGAVFSHNLEFYNCTLQKSLRKYQLASQVHLEKAEDLVAHYNYLSNQQLDPNHCLQRYQAIVDELSLRAQIERKNFTGASNYLTNHHTLETANQELSLLSCPVIY